jgi:hypothetical protein
MDISEPGASLQIRITIEDSEFLKSEKLVPEEPWYKVESRLLKELKELRKLTKKPNQV